MKTTLIALALTLSGTAFASSSSEGPEVLSTQQLDGVSSIFLGNPEVARALAVMNETAGRVVFVDQIVVMKPLISDDGVVTNEVCIQLDWYGGDVMGWVGKITGNVTQKPYPRGTVSYRVTDIVSINAENQSGRCL